MAQAGIHGMVGMAVRKLAPNKQWLMLGIVIGNLLPDLDNLAVAVATITGGETEGLHRTFSHSLITVVAVILVFWLIGAVIGKVRWRTLGWGLGIGILMHSLLDLLIWFDGVELLWPFGGWVNFWEGYTPAEWWSKLMMPIEFLFLALFFLVLAQLARKHNTDQDYLGRLRIWTWILLGLFVVFTILVYTLESGFMTPYGAVYLLALLLALGVTIRMHQTVDMAV